MRTVGRMASATGSITTRWWANPRSWRPKATRRVIRPLKRGARLIVLDADERRCWRGFLFLRGGFFIPEAEERDDEKKG